MTCLTIGRALGALSLACALGCGGGKQAPATGPAPSLPEASADQAEPVADANTPVTVGDATNCFPDAVDLTKYACFSVATPNAPELSVHRDEVFACVKTAGVMPPVTLIAQLALRADGGVAEMTVRGDEAVAACLSARAAAWSFTPPAAGATGPSTTVIRLRTKD